MLTQGMVVRLPHSAYYSETGDEYPSVTTVLDNLGLATMPMCYAAWKLGKEGKHFKEEWGKAADIGTVVHALVEQDMMDSFGDGGVELSAKARKLRDEFTDWQQEQAETCMDGYRAWKRFEASDLGIYLLESEEEVINEEYNYGGTFDFRGYVDGEHTILDLKTSKGLYPSHVIQQAAYVRAYNDGLPQGQNPVTQAALLRLDKEKNEYDWHVMVEGDFEPAFDVFACMRKVYDSLESIDV